jgi:serine/threonine protein kinase
VAQAQLAEKTNCWRGFRVSSIITTEKQQNDAEMKIAETRDLESLNVDWDHPLGYRMGDLTFMHTKSFRCYLKKDEKPIKKRLVVTRIDCMDQFSYNKKIEEVDKFIRFSHHPNVATMYSYWVSKPINENYYKTMFVLYEEALVGDLDRCLVTNPLKPSRTTVSKYICDLAKGLGMLHQSGVVHGAIRATNLFINEDNQLQLGPIKKSETESLRGMIHLLSKFNIGRYIKQYIIYMAPEVLRDEEITMKSDIWSVGIIIYILLTGEYPFDIKKEETLINNIKDAAINWRPLIDHPRFLNMLRKILTVDPSQRWSIQEILSYAQEEFILIIQRNFRGFKDRKNIKKIMKAVVKIQAYVKGWLVRKLYQRKRFEVRWKAAEVIQRRLKQFKNSEKLRIIRFFAQFLQSRVLARQIRRSYLKLKKDTVTAQAFIRKYLVYTSYRAINYKKAELTQDLASKSNNIEKYRKLASVYFPFQSGAAVNKGRAIGRGVRGRGDGGDDDDDIENVDEVLERNKRGK